MVSVGTVYFADGHTESINWIEEIGVDEIKFGTVSGIYIHKTCLVRRGAVMVPEREFYKCIFGEDYYGDSVPDFVIVDICKVEIFEN